MISSLQTGGQVHFRESHSGTTVSILGNLETANYNIAPDPCVPGQLNTAKRITIIMQTSVARQSIITGLSAMAVGMVYGMFISSEALGHPVLTLATYVAVTYISCRSILTLTSPILSSRRAQTCAVHVKWHTSRRLRTGA